MQTHTHSHTTQTQTQTQAQTQTQTQTRAQGDFTFTPQKVMSSSGKDCQHEYVFEGSSRATTDVASFESHLCHHVLLLGLLLLGLSHGGGLGLGLGVRHLHTTQSNTSGY